MSNTRICALAAPFVLLLVACAPTTSQQRPVKAADEAKINAIYADVDRAGVRGDEGLKAYRDGDAAGATTAFAQAREMFTAAAGQCTATPGCEIERVLVAQDALIDRQAKQLLDGIASDDASAETPETAVVGETEAGPATTSPILRTVPEASRSLALLRGQDIRKMIAMNEPMKAALEEWLTWMRPNLLDAYEHYQYMRHRMWPAYENSGMPEALLFGILAKESGGKVHAVSRAGASGPLQFMYYTGVRYGLTKESGFDMRFDPASAARANAAYLNDQFRLLNNDLELALGAYNGGEGRMQRLSGGGQRRFYDPRVFNALPPETRDYVPMVLAAAWLFLHPAEYGLEFPVIDTTPGEIVLTQAASLNELSVCLGQAGNPRGWFRTLRNLNARHDPNDRLAVGTRLDVPRPAAQAYARTCTQGAALADISRQLHEARPPVANAQFARAAGTGASRTHVVARGETLSSIARKFGCSDPRVIATANRIPAPRYAIRAGQRLVVPSCRA